MRHAIAIEGETGPGPLYLEPGALSWDDHNIPIMKSSGFDITDFLGRATDFQRDDDVISAELNFVEQYQHYELDKTKWTFDAGKVIRTAGERWIKSARLLTILPQPENPGFPTTSTTKDIFMAQSIKAKDIVTGTHIVFNGMQVMVSHVVHSKTLGAGILMHGENLRNGNPVNFRVHDPEEEFPLGGNNV